MTATELSIIHSLADILPRRGSATDIVNSNAPTISEIIKPTMAFAAHPLWKISLVRQQSATTKLAPAKLVRV